MTRSRCCHSQTMLLQLACVASFLVQSNFSFVRFGVQPSKRPSFYPTGTHADCESVILLSSSSSSSDPHPPEKPPPKSVLERAAYFATPEKERARRTPDNESEDDVDVEVKAQASESFPSYTPGDASRFEVNEELLEWGNKAVEHVFVSCFNCPYRLPYPMILSLLSCVSKRCSAFLR
jgi:hypothetical protein